MKGRGNRTKISALCTNNITVPSINAIFIMEFISGDIIVKTPLDHEVAMQHNLTVMVSDQGMSPNRNFTRVLINILDHNDHQPVFLSDVFRGRVFETAAVGTSVVQVMAVDQDKGHNAELTYSILSGIIHINLKLKFLKPLFLIL